RVCGGNAKSERVEHHVDLPAELFQPAIDTELLDKARQRLCLKRLYGAIQIGRFQLRRLRYRLLLAPALGFEVAESHVGRNVAKAVRQPTRRNGSRFLERRRRPRLNELA